MKLFNILNSILYILLSSVVICEEVTLTSVPVFCNYKNKDTIDTYDINSDNVINCSSKFCTINGSGATSSEGVISITSAGTYIVQGSLEGQIHIEATEQDFIHLVLNGATITSNNGPAIYGVSANKITITVVGENKLSDSTNYTVVDEEPDACLFVDADLSINGPGSITVSGNYGDAIRCKKDLKIVSGNVIVSYAVQRGIKAKNSLCIKDGTVDVNSANSGIKVTRDNSSEKGYIVIDGGNIAISTKNDALHAETHLTINGGYIDIKESAEGIEGQMIDIIGGEIHVLASDDGINASKISNSDSNTSDNMDNKQGGMQGGMAGGESSGSDGSVYINIVGGKIYVTVEGNDVDGIDSNGVLYIGGEAEVYSCIKGGDVYGNMAALDADGTNAIVSGATVVVAADSSTGGGMIDGMNGSMGDHGDNINANSNMQASPMKRQEQNQEQNQEQMPQGGFMDGNMGNMNSTDPNGGMMGPGGTGGNHGGPGGMGESGSIYQAYIQTSVNSKASGSEIIIKDSNENIIISFTPNTSYSNILVSSPSFVAGQTYTIITGNDFITATASEADSGSVDPPSVTSPSEALEYKNSTSDGYRNKINFLSIILTLITIIIIC